MSNFNASLSSFFKLNSVKNWLIVHWQFLVLGISLPLLLFIILALKIGENASGLSWDVSILFSVYSPRQTQLEKLVFILTRAGMFPGIFWLATPVISTLGYQKKWRSLLYFFLTLLGSGLISISTKIFFHRMRPDFGISTHPLPTDFSFPSGHALLSMAFTIALVILTWKTKWRGLVIGLGGLFVLTIAWTRLYLGVHFPSDILGGWLLAITWAVLASLLLNLHQFDILVSDQSSKISKH
ncbi:phosphatase PAP2 family protein [Planktothrix paucivesiculata]|uniref:Phosphoesterase PA-phosphatase related protein n=1 Tax=Planktothrix paucivesiculata PCC 9631 TaxID=671071 RepID=A0A7Z9E0R7_9CYAN|nr:phosphatase PAP2 family protein [Planktothrix paucivesiculata]VXD21743.1 Phosphoesterase PA-phosphatase related protein [Planktothrix paucivesiculata PCC 9631]